MSFPAALIDRQSPPPPGLRHAHRFNVYRNNVASALIRALAVRYPAVERLVGAEFFSGMAGAFALAHLPQTPVLSNYGGEFPQFIESFAPAAGLAYLAGVARLESAWWRAYHAADAPAADARDFAAIPPERLGNLRIAAHPSVTLIRSRHAALSIWRRQRGDGDLGGLDLDTPEAALIARPGADVEVTALSPDEAAVLSRLIEGQPLAAALAAAPDLTDPTHLFTRLVASRIAATLNAEETP